MSFKMKGWSGWSPLKQKEDFGEKARRARMMRPIEGEHVEGQPKGSKSTHLMASGESDGKHIAYPTITNKTESGKYKPQSFSEAVGAKEVFQFDTPEEAENFAKGNWKLKLASDLHKDIKKK